MALRLTASIASGGIAAVAVIAIVMPLALKSPSPPSLKAILSQHLWAAAGVSALIVTLIVVLTLLHAFVSAGNARTYIDGELAAPAVTTPPPPTGGFRAFDLQRWVQAARSFMWRVAGIYVSVTAIWCLLFVVMAGVLMAFRAAAGLLVCCGFIVVIPLALAAFVFSAVGTAKAVILCVHRSTSVRDSLVEAWNLTVNKLGVHFWTACLIGLAAVVVGLVIAVVSGVLNMAAPSNHAPFAMAFAPMQIALFVVQQVFGAGVTCWFAASMTALAEIRETPLVEPTALTPAAPLPPAPDH